MNDRWEEFLDPQILRTRLISASLFLAAFEILKDAVIGRIRNFFCLGFDEQHGPLTNPEYESDVLSRNKSPVYASLLWLQENRVIDAQDLARFEKLKESRNRIAHEMTEFLQGKGPPQHATLFPEIVYLLRKIEVWWIVNVELPTDPDSGGEEIDESQVVPGSVITLKLMVDIALGSEKESAYYLNEFRKRRTKP
ncbi:MAG TPA: hypothetical protein VJ085_02370 [Candidatus Acidoferrales bacterium]|nr:hypothetical protein [Candidatus Acidoferrales bacterium]